jgi:hypothetical protein
LSNGPQRPIVEALLRQQKAMPRGDASRPVIGQREGKQWRIALDPQYCSFVSY